MSMKGLSSSSSSSSLDHPDKIFKRSSHNKCNDSGELDVFEAARYFSGYNDPAARVADDSYGGSYTHNKYNNHTIREENRRRWGLGRGRISLDLPTRSSSEPVHHHHHNHNQDQHHVLEKHEVFIMKEKIGNVKHKQPSSPGGKITSFLNSLFHQAGSKKNKSKSKSTPKARDELEESPGGWRRRRRSSISHFLTSSRSSNTASTTTDSSSKSLFSSTSSGFRTPPPCLNTPTKNYKGFLMNHVEMNKKNNKELSWLDEKLKLIETLSEGHRVWSEDDRVRQINGGTAGVEDDGGESDSSSDLFELQNYDLSYGGLPVYETTNVNSIKKSTAPISSTRPV